MKRAMRLGLCVALAAPAIGMLASPSPARAFTGVTSGYWWQAQGDSGVLPPPPSVPQGGLWVSSNAAGAQAVSAVRFVLDTGESTPITLKLKVNSAQPQSQVNLAAYATTTSWSATQAGPWSQRPAYDPASAPAIGALSSDGTTMTFDLSSLAAGPSVNVVIVPVGAAVSTSGTPAPAPPTAPVPTTAPSAPGLPAPPAPPVTTPVPAPTPAPGSPTFDVTFSPVTSNAIAVASLPLPVENVAPPPTDAPAVAAPPLTPALPSDTPAFTQSPITVATAPPATVAATARRPVVALRRPIPAAAHPFGRSARDRLLLGFLLFDVALYLFWASGSGATPKLPQLSLYDDPGERRATVLNRRTGTPPPIR